MEDMLIDSHDLWIKKKKKSCFVASSISNFQQERNLLNHKNSTKKILKILHAENN